LSDVDDVSDDAVAVATADLLVVVIKALPGREEEEDAALRPTAMSGVFVGRLVTPGDTVKADVVEAEEATTVAKAIAENFILSIVYILFCRIK
jgi:hypothetical protein